MVSNRDRRHQQIHIHSPRKKPRSEQCLESFYTPSPRKNTKLHNEQNGGDPAPINSCARTDTKPRRLLWYTTSYQV
ncbi:uncharacterized protein LACBIDRAFT_297613 [Laccaria bicolor S238N-H82]|uniref:Predicted protein n=1 Tax=Laccaria bicolor (strain S238N-H82 / ATCC MYA-4686) TaxID=486041 RepID=B0DBL4_LACBS|nr:uncharacterized protein LACBIDRAFT_297613 [Laccaria bicolor S238N-H82]EDR08020.1 predicted protein [Laccaria bicolor S238N-H82]|eukprot:XP_001881090.1 predicted protein [Laccaria bicolor S238N-H82]